jgi:FkbM family methyltransferase
MSHTNKLLARFDFQISRVSKLEINRSRFAAEFLRNSRTVCSQDWTVSNFLAFVAQQGTKPLLSNSQLFQDYFALYCNQNVTSGYFVEFGACNGVEGSNTVLLERGYQWNGVLAEPARQWRQDLRVNRSCSIDNRCVYSSSGDTLEFVECGQLSTIKSYADDNNDWAKELRQAPSNQYSVTTVSLVDLLESHNAPAEINYMSVDTEGSEFDCLRYFDFEKYSIRCLTVEHNYEPSRELVHNLLSNNGFVRVLTDVSDFDDWFVHESIIN